VRESRGNKPQDINKKHKKRQGREKECIIRTFYLKGS
jgi:hypothetical protein